MPGRRTPPPGEGTPIPVEEGDRKRRLADVDAHIHEADEYLQKWERAMDELKTHFTPTGPEWSHRWQREHAAHMVRYEWHTNEIERFFSWYREVIVPLRARQQLGAVGAHKTDTPSLFGGAVRHQGTHGRGILREGITKGDFGQFESKEAGGQGGWWYGESIGGDHPSRECWIVRGEGSYELAVRSGTPRPFTLVFTDPRTYRGYLDELRKLIESGEVPVLHHALRLDQLRQWLEERQGRWPDEVAETEGGT